MEFQKVTRPIPRLMLAGTGSGCGKTTVTCAVLKALANRGVHPASFKTGPDYIDPMFHAEILGLPSRNLDLFLCGEDTVRCLLSKGAAEADCALIEGVMGFYDGLSANSPEKSSWDLSECTQTPVVLVVNCAGKSLSMAAEIKGYLDFLPNHIAGVILNGASEAMYPVYRELIIQHTGLSVLGYLPKLLEAAVASRHLGLVTAAEVSGLRDKMELLARNAERTIDLDGLLALARTAPEMTTHEPLLCQRGATRIAIAKDAAFCFYYQDALDLLSAFGAELIAFSPLTEKQLPANIDGLILGGGYPELWVQMLSENVTMRQSIWETAKQGVPIWGECGGFMYLQQAIEDEEGRCWPMAGVLPGTSRLTKKLVRFGYTELTALKDTLLCPKDEILRAHEFHYSDSDQNGTGFHARKPNRSREWDCIQTTENLIAGYPHIHLWGNLTAAEHFYDRILTFKKGSHV